MAGYESYIGRAQYIAIAAALLGALVSCSRDAGDESYAPPKSANDPANFLIVSDTTGYEVGVGAITLSGCLAVSPEPSRGSAALLITLGKSFEPNNNGGELTGVKVITGNGEVHNASPLSVDVLDGRIRETLAKANDAIAILADPELSRPGGVNCTRNFGPDDDLTIEGPDGAPVDPVAGIIVHEKSPGNFVTLNLG